MKPHSLTYLLFLSVFAVILGSCGEQHFYQRSITLEEGLWNYEDTLTYEVEIKDTTSRYDIGLRIRHSKDYPSENLYIRILTFFPDDQTLGQTLSLDFADHTGQWYGNCNGQTCTVHIVLQENAIFNQIGIHRFQLVQYMRIDPVEEIENVDFFLDKKSG